MDQSNIKKKRYLRWALIRLAMVICDIIAVNAAYFGALLTRFYVASEFNVWAVRYISAFAKFAPFYTLCCLAVFWLFRLYDSRWKYAGLSDLNRILTACLVTCVIQVAGSMAFVMRMPITYYFIGALLQFALVAFFRFSYRLFLVERDRVRKRLKKTVINVMIVGVGETSRVVLRHLERDVDNAAQPACLVDFRGSEFGSMQQGLPVIDGIDKIPGALEKYRVETVILADTTMPQEVRTRIRSICRDAQVEVQDFAGFFQDFRGAVSLRNLLEYAKGPVELVFNGKRRAFESGEEALLSLSGKYVVTAISAKERKLVIDLKTDILVPNDVKEEWVQSYKEETGEDISFF